MKSIISIILLLLIYSNIYAVDEGLRITIETSDNEFYVNNDYEVLIILKNDSEIHQIDLRNINITMNYCDINYGNIPNQTIPIGQEFSFPITISSKHNISSNLVVIADYEIFRTRSSNYSELPITFKTNSSYFDTTNDLWGDELLNETKELISYHREFTYRDARIIMWEQLNNYDGQVECVYSAEILNHTSGIPDVNATGFNTEHTWPQSFGSDREPEKSDMHHIFPTQQNANSTRASFPFGYVVSNVQWERAESKLGRDENGRTVFEVRDQHKGDAARALMYFLLKYGNKDFFITNQLETLIEWHYFDLPDEHEIRRNNIIFENQENRNPFIDNPYFIERVISILDGGNVDHESKLLISEDTLIFNSSQDGINRSFLYVYSTNSSISNLTIENENYSIGRTQLNEGSINGAVSFIEIISPTTPNNGLLKIDFEDGSHENVYLETINITSIESKENFNFYPNPIEKGEVLNFKNLNNNGSISIIDLNGNQKSIDFINYEFSIPTDDLQRGVYFILINQEVHKLVVI